MRKPRQAIALVVSALLALAAGYFSYAISKGDRSVNDIQQATSEALFTTKFNDLNGVPQSLEQWRGKAMVVNFWATWCAPCRKEIPELVKAQEKYHEQGLTIIGIAVDIKENVVPFIKENGVVYPVLVDNSSSVDVSKKLGNRVGGLPFTVFLNKNGDLVDRELGGLSEARLDDAITALLKSR